MDGLELGMSVLSFAKRIKTTLENNGSSRFGMWLKAGLTSYFAILLPPPLYLLPYSVQRMDLADMFGAKNVPDDDPCGVAEVNLLAQMFDVTHCTETNVHVSMCLRINKCKHESAS